MQKAFYPVFSPSLGNHGAVNNGPQALTSDALSELHIFNNSYKGAFLMNSDHCDGFQLTGFSHPDQEMLKQTPPLSFSMTSVNGSGVVGRGAKKGTVVASSRTVSLVACYPTVMPDSMRDHTSKRQKTSSQAEMLHPPSLITESAQVQSQSSSRSQKLGDKITALQQLVSPFGKTDTASVLREATVCIKFLHEQLRVLTSPYFQSKSSAYQMEYQEGLSFHSRGLCLVPVSKVINFSDHDAALNHYSNETTSWSH